MYHSTTLGKMRQQIITKFEMPSIPAPAGNAQPKSANDTIILCFPRPFLFTLIDRVSALWYDWDSTDRMIKRGNAP